MRGTIVTTSPAGSLSDMDEVRTCGETELMYDWEGASDAAGVAV